MRNKTPAIDPRSGRHGKAAAIALWLEIEDRNAPTEQDVRFYGEPETIKRDRATVSAYLAGYQAARGPARRGFVTVLSDFISMVHGCGTPNAPLWQERYLRPPMSDAERKAHVRVWLKGGAS